MIIPGDERELARHNYGKRLLAMLAEGKLEAGQLTHVDIYHDGWCAIYAGGYCNCDPEDTASALQARGCSMTTPSVVVRWQNASWVLSRVQKCACYGLAPRRVVVLDWAYNVHGRRVCTRCGLRLRVWHRVLPADDERQWEEERARLRAAGKGWRP